MESATISSPPEIGNKTIAILGCPNTGKSTLFNRLTGLRQKVANYPGVTVERHVGKSTLSGITHDIIDLPGTYSMAAESPDERVVIDALEGRFSDDTPDLLLCVVDPLQLRRQLFLILQAAELGIPSILCLNFWDRVERRKASFHLEVLERELGIPCIPVSATSGKGLDQLETAIEAALESPSTINRIRWSPPIQEALEEIEQGAEKVNVLLNRADALRILFDAHPAVAARLDWDEPYYYKLVQDTRNRLHQKAIHPLAAEAVFINKRIDTLLKEVLPDELGLSDPTSKRLDKVFTHPVGGPILFLALIFLVFQSVYSWAGPIMDLIDGAKVWVQDIIEPLFAATPIVQSMVVDGIIEGVGSVLIFLPQILILFFFITVLEDTGYMARAAFLMDKMFSWCGLNGKSFVPLISSYACAIPGIMAARTIEDPKSRLTTIFVAPFMSCSARLPVYVLLIGAFIEPVYGAFWAGVALFGMHIVGLLIAAPVAWFMNKVMLKSKGQPFLMELPSYRFPRLPDIGLRLIAQGARFVREAGTIIFSITIVIWALLYFPRPVALAEQQTQAFITELDQAGTMTAQELAAYLEAPESFPELEQSLQDRIDSAYIEQSVMGRLGKLVQPVFALAGFDWKITVGVLSSFPAREVIISTMGVIYSLGGDVDAESGDLRAVMANQVWPEGTAKAGQRVFNIPVALAIMVFFALCQQCGATVAIMSRELNNRWAFGSFFFMTGVAWLGAILTYQLGMLFI